MDFSPFVDTVVQYIAGYVSAKLGGKLHCDTCRKQLFGDEMPKLVALKNQGPYKAPSKDVISICRLSETVLRNEIKSLSNQFYKSRLVNKIISKIAGLPFANEIMTKHVLAARDIFDNHRIQLVKLVVTLYVEIRLFHECRKSNMPKDYIRHQLSKFILFKNQ